MAYTHKSEKKEKLRQKNIEMLETLPDFCTRYVYYVERSISPVTLNAYLQRITRFLHYLHTNNSYFANKDICKITISDLAALELDDINAFAHWIFTTNNNHVRNNYSERISSTNQATTVDNYLSALNSLWEYFVAERYIKYNPVSSVRRAKKQEKEIIKLEYDEKDAFLDSVYCGDGFNEKQLEWNERTKIRDIAIIRTLLGTGIRVSELVGMDVDDLDFQHNCFKVIRKRDKIDVVYFDDEVKECLKDYLEERIPRYQPVDNENALFLVGIGKYKGTRLSERSIQKLVKKFAKASLSNGKAALITPHKLRATYATELLEVTGNLDLVREDLGHSDPKTTNRYSKTSSRVKEKNRNILIQSSLDN